MKPSSITSITTIALLALAGTDPSFAQVAEGPAQLRADAGQAVRAADVIAGGGMLPGESPHARGEPLAYAWDSVGDGELALKHGEAAASRDAAGKARNSRRPRFEAHRWTFVIPF